MNGQILIRESIGGINVESNLTSRMYEDRVCYLFDEVNKNTANYLFKQFSYLEAKDPSKEITLIINSPGGIISDGLVIYDIMQTIKNDIRTICVGTAASMASVLLAGGTKGKRLIYPHAEVLIHQPLGGMQGQASDLQIQMEHMNNCKNQIIDILSMHTGKTKARIKKDIDRDNWMNAKEAVEYGLVDRIVSE